MRPNTNARPDVQPALTLALDSEKSASLPPPVLLNVGIQGHPGRLACSCPRASSRPTHGASNCLSARWACVFSSQSPPLLPCPFTGGSDTEASTHPPQGIHALCSHQISSSGPSLYLAPLCLAISIPTCREREREREREAISAPTTGPKEADSTFCCRWYHKKNQRASPSPCRHAQEMRGGACRAEP